jgi:hypothetical protein
MLEHPPVPEFGYNEDGRNTFFLPLSSEPIHIPPHSVKSTEDHRVVKVVRIGGENKVHTHQYTLWVKCQVTGC